MDTSDLLEFLLHDDVQNSPINRSKLKSKWLSDSDFSNTTRKVQPPSIGKQFVQIEFLDELTKGLDDLILRGDEKKAKSKHKVHRHKKATQLNKREQDLDTTDIDSYPSSKSGSRTKKIEEKSINDYYDELAIDETHKRSSRKNQLISTNKTALERGTSKQRRTKNPSFNTVKANSNFDKKIEVDKNSNSKGNRFKSRKNTGQNIQQDVDNDHTILAPNVPNKMRTKSKKKRLKETNEASKRNNDNSVDKSSKVVSVQKNMISLNKNPDIIINDQEGDKKSKEKASDEIVIKNSNKKKRLKKKVAKDQ